MREALNLSTDDDPDEEDTGADPDGDHRSRRMGDAHGYYMNMKECACFRCVSCDNGGAVGGRIAKCRTSSGASLLLS
eukprot:6763542-Prymnesium_polylepis.2